MAVLHIEDLTWVTTEKGMSRWTMGKTATKIEHTGARHGVKVVRVNAANTSQQCHKCREKVTHNTTRRVVLCKNCKTALDRDFNAALNIAKKQGFRPFLPGVRKRGVGENFSPARETTGSPLVEITVRT